MTFQDDYQRKFGKPIEADAWIIQQRGIEGFAGRPDIQAWWRANPDAVSYAQGMPLQGGQYYSAGTVTTSIGGSEIPKEKTVTTTTVKEATENVYYTKVGTTAAGGVILEKTDANGRILGRETVPPKKWEAMRADYYASMTPEEKESSRMATVTAITSQKSYKVGEKEMTFKEYVAFETEAATRARNPLAMIAFSGARIMSNPVGLATSIVTGEKGFKSFLKATKQEQIDIQKHLMLHPESRGGLAVQMAIEPIAVGVTGMATMITPSTSLLGKVTTGILSKPMVTAAISGALFAKGTSEFVRAAPAMMKDEVTVARGRAIREGGMGIVQMGIGSYGLQKSFEAMFPKPIKVEIKTVGSGRALHKLSEKEFVGLKQTDMVAKVGNQKYVARAMSDYYGSMKGDKLMTGFGQVDIKFHALKGDVKGATHAFFETKIGKINMDTFYGQTVYGDVAGAKVSPIFIRDTTGIKLAQAGIDMSLKAGTAKGMHSLTKITTSYSSTGLPSETFTIFSGSKVAGAEYTYISYIKMPSELSSGGGIVTGGTGLKTTTTTSTISGLEGISTEVGKSSLKEVLKGFVVAPSAPSTIFLGSGQNIKTEKTTILKQQALPSISIGQTSTTSVVSSKKTTTLSPMASGGLKLSGTTEVKLGLSPITTPIGIQGQMTQQETRIAQGLKTTEMTTTISPPSQTPTSISIPSIPLIGFGGGFRMPKWGKRGRKFRRGETYSPSIAGIFGFGKSFKMPKVELGIRIRRRK